MLSTFRSFSQLSWVALSAVIGAAAAAQTPRLPAAADSSCVQTIGTIAALRALPAPGPLQAPTYLVRGYHAPGDAGGGLFGWEATSTATDDGGTALSPNGHTGPGRWLRQLDGDRLSVRWFGAGGDGANDDAPAIQSAIDALTSVSPGRSEVFLPPGTYACDQTIALPVGIQGLEIRGAGWSETDPTATVLRNRSSGPLFETSGTGTCAFLSVSNFRLMQSPTSGYFFRFVNPTVYAHLSRLHCNMSNTGAGAVLFDRVEAHMNVLEDIKVVTNGATVPMFHVDGPADSNVTTTTFRRLWINTPNATAPQILVEHNHVNAAPGFVFDTLNLEQPDGGGVHLYGVHGAYFRNCVASDTSSQTAPVFLFDKKVAGQAFLGATMVQCHSFIGTQAAPCIKMNVPVVGGPGPGPLNLIGGRYTWIDNGPYSVNALGTSIARQVPGSESILHVNLNALTGVQGIQDVVDSGLVARAQNHSGFAEFAGGGAVGVTFPPERAEPDADYRIQVSGDANESFWVPAAAKTTTGFQILSSNPSSTAKVVWTLVRGV